MPYQNPYIAGNAISHPEVLYGRDELLAEIRRDFEIEDVRVGVISGQRRIGKTSVLLNLERSLQSSAFCPVYFDLLGEGSRSSSQTLAELAKRSLKRLGSSENLTNPVLVDSDDWIRELQSFAHPRRLLFLLDEFDTLDRSANQPVRAEDYAQLLDFLRRETSRPGGPSILLSMGIKVDDLSVAASSLVRTASRRTVKFIDQTSAINLVKRGEKVGGMRFNVGVPEKIIDITGCHPYLIQLICHTLWEVVDNHETVKLSDIDDALPSVFDRGEHGFEWIWSGLEINEKAALCAVAIAYTGHSTKDEIVDTLANERIQISDAEIHVALNRLVGRDLLAEVKFEYCCSVELFRLWVYNNNTLSDIREAQGRRTDANAGRLADFYYQHGDRTQAERLARLALNENPKDYAVLLLLSKLLFDDGRLDDSISYAESAYRYEGSYSRGHLVKLIMDEVHRAHDNARRLQLYDRLLNMIPDCESALESRTALWIEEASDAIRNGKLSLALRGYRQAVSKGVDGACGTLTDLFLTSAELYEARTQFSKARSIYQALAECDSQNPKYELAIRALDFNEASTRAHSGRPQEVARGLLTAFAILVVLGALSRFETTQTPASHSPGATTPEDYGATTRLSPPLTNYTSQLSTYNYRPIQVPNFTPIPIPRVTYSPPPLPAYDFKPIQFPELTLSAGAASETGMQNRGTLVPASQTVPEQTPDTSAEPPEFLAPNGEVYRMLPAEHRSLSSPIQVPERQ